MTCRCRTNRSTEPLNPSSTLSTWYLFLQDEQSPCRLARPWSSRGGCDDVARGQFGRSVGCKRGLASILCLSERGALATQPLPQPLVCFNAECAFRLGLRLQKSRQDHLDWSKSNRQSITCLVRILHAKGPALCLGFAWVFYWSPKGLDALYLLRVSHTAAAAQLGLAFSALACESNHRDRKSLWLSLLTDSSRPERLGTTARTT